MKKVITQKQKLSRLLSVLTLLLGMTLLIYMIIVEDEPGAVPLFLIFVGASWFFINQHQIKKQLR
jgi:hypothetical protein